MPREPAAHCHPALRPVRGAIGPAVERATDETAATVGDRRVIAPRRPGSPCGGGFPAGGHPGSVPQRVAVFVHLAPRPPSRQSRP
ncbi:hypothetical protein ACWEOA_25755 [Streptomyces sp. NPDC004457]